MKTLKPLGAGLLVIFAGGCVGAESTTYNEQAVPVSMAPPPAPVAQTVPAATEAPPPPQAYAAPARTATTVVTGTAATASVQPLDQLVAPIALYPDVLVALILPASTVSSDVVLAARYLGTGGDPQQVDAQPWDDSVKGLAHYPEVVKWMDENLAWTQQLGAAYLENAENVMTAIQRVRTEARAKGLLASTPQQQVVVENDVVEIVPAQPDVIYVPRYDPEIIFVDRPVIYETDPWLTFGVGFGVGWWLSYDFDWYHRRIWVDRHSRDHWRDRHEWRQPHFVGGGGAPRPGWEQWHPSPNRPRPPHRDFDRRPVVRPTPIPGSPHYNGPHRDNDHRDVPHRDANNRRDNDRPRDRDRSPTRPPSGAPSAQTPTGVRHFRPVDSNGNTVVAPQAPAAQPTPDNHNNRNGERRRPDRRDESGAARPRTDRTQAGTPPSGGAAPAPQPRPRLEGQPPREREHRADRVAPTAQPVPQAPRVAPPAERVQSQPQPEARRAMPAPAQREQHEQRETHVDRAPRSDPPARVAPSSPPVRQNNSDNAPRSRGGDERDKSRQQEN